MRLVARYDYAWTVIHRPEPVPGLLIELHPHYVHAVSSNPVMLGPWWWPDPARAGSARPMLGPANRCTSPAAAPTGPAGTR